MGCGVGSIGLRGDHHGRIRVFFPHGILNSGEGRGALPGLQRRLQDGVGPAGLREEDFVAIPLSADVARVVKVDDGSYGAGAAPISNSVLDRKLGFHRLPRGSSQNHKQPICCALH